MIVLGLVGEKGSGKETFVNFLKEVTTKKILHVRFSDILKQTLMLWGLPVTRANLQKLAVVMDENFGKGSVTRALFEQLQGADSEVVVLDGIRWETDLALLRKFKNNKLIYITADVKLRFERLKKRGEKEEEITASYNQFLKEEKAKNELLIPKFGKSADFKIENNASLEEYRKKVKQLAESLF